MIFENQYPGETAYIVGSGPSLAHLRAQHFGPGPVITINMAIVPVQKLNLPNPLYSLQKDGCSWDGVCICKPGPAQVQLRPDVVCILQEPGYSQSCFPDHPRRVYVDPAEMGLEASEMSIRMAICLARWMGCARIVLLCTDSLTGNDTRSYDVFRGQPVDLGFSGTYAAVRPVARRDLKTIPHQFVTPEPAHAE